MNKKTLTFAALVIALSLETVEAFQKEFNHSGVIQKGLTYDSEANTTAFRYTDSKGITKWYTIEGEIPLSEAPESFTASVIILNGEDQIEPFDKEFKHEGIIRKGIIVDDVTGDTTFKYAESSGAVKQYTIEGALPVLDTPEEKPAAAKKASAKKPAAKKSAAKKAAAKKPAAKK